MSVASLTAAATSKMIRHTTAEMSSQHSVKSIVMPTIISIECHLLFNTCSLELTFKYIE